MVRYIDETSATVWVEIDSACEVAVLGHSAPSFAVAGHHYALVVIEGLQPGRSYEYGVTRDGRRRWPDPRSAPPGSPASRIRTLDCDATLKLCFGSCRKAAPHGQPQARRAGIDAIWALAQTMRRQSQEE